jgi:spectinomycin phosphotransferase
VNNVAVRALPVGLDEREVIEAVRTWWELDVEAISYVPEGGGSYHWLAETSHGTRYFVTADDLDSKTWLGTDRSSVFDGLRGAFDTALMLREHERRAFVVAPIPTRDAESLHRVSLQYSLAVFPFVDGHTGEFAETLGPADRGRLLRLLAELHQSSLDALPQADRRGLELPGRAKLEGALRELDQRWASGPFGEPARTLLASNAADVARWLKSFDRLTAQVGDSGGALVITHGEPHPANVIHVEDELFLIDWDTVGLAPPERDLWMLDDGSPDNLKLYTDATGREIDGAALSLYRLTWTLADVAAFSAVLRSDHQETADTIHALRALHTYLD